MGNRVPHTCSSRNRCSQQTSAGRSEKLPSVNRFTNARAAHPNPPKSPSHPGQITARGIIRFLGWGGSQKIVLVGQNAWVSVIKLVSRKGAQAGKLTKIR